MASDKFQGQERQRFPGLLLVGLVMGLVVIVAAWALLGSEFGIPLLILAVILVAAAVGYRLIAGSERDESDETSGGLPNQPPNPDRPLGDTSEAHDELSPHDLPLDNPGRHVAERMAAGGEQGTTRGMEQGGAAGDGGPAEGDTEAVGPEESQGARPGA